MIESERERAKLSHLAALERARVMAPVESDVHARGRRRLVDAAVRAGAPGARRSLAWVGVAAALLGVGALGLAAFFLLRPLPLEYRVEGAGNLASNYVSAGATAPAVVRFSDGSRVTAQAGTGVRIDAPASTGATLFVEHGVATAEVFHRNGATAATSTWRFVAGPFEVRVTGTRFTIAWDPRTEEMDLVMHEGSVEVRSPIGEGHFAVKAGQRFHASLPLGTTKLENLAAVEAPRSATAPPAATPQVTVPPAVVLSPPSASPSVAVSSPAPAPAPAPSWAVQPDADGPSWPELSRQGKFETVVTRATRLGLEGCLAACSVQDLRALADAARYTSHTELATRSLLSLRKRFGPVQGSTAAFLLGRTHESSGALNLADDWYRVYLSEAPGGEFAAEALAGRMRVVSGIHGPAAAKPLALEYLTRYPKGASARAARGLGESH